MSKRTLIFVVICWCILTLVKYYLLPYFIVLLLWLGLSLGLLIVAIIQFVKLIRERKTLSKLRMWKFFVFAGLFYLTFDSSLVDGLIEKAEWKVYYEKRMNIVQQVEGGELNPNVSWNNWVCELPFEFPVISNGGNDIGIYRNKNNNTLTVTFWIYRNYFEAPSIQFVYTNDSDQIKVLDQKATIAPKQNWKIQDNWYRTDDDE
jgi:hypothetical protein